MGNQNLPYWVTSSFPIIRIVLVCIIALCAITLIVSTLMQSNSNDNTSQALSGGTRESYYAQNKGESRDGKLKKITTAMAITIAVCTLLYFVSLLIYRVA